MGRSCYIGLQNVFRGFSIWDVDVILAILFARDPPLWAIYEKLADIFCKRFPLWDVYSTFSVIYFERFYFLVLFLSHCMSYFPSHRNPLQDVSSTLNEIIFAMGPPFLMYFWVVTFKILFIDDCNLFDSSYLIPLYFTQNCDTLNFS